MLTKPSLLAHEFVILDQRETADKMVPERLSVLWKHCSDLGMLDRTVPEAVLAAEAGQTPHIVGVKARDDRLQAVLTRTSDAAGITACLASASDGSNWHELDRMWPHEPAPPIDRKRFTVRVYVGYVPSVDLRSSEDWSALAAALRKAVPDAGDGSWAQRWARISPGFVLWEAPPREPRERRIILIAEESTEGAVDAFAWTSGAFVLGRFTSYLLDATRLRYEQAVHGSRSREVRDLREEVDRAVDRVLTLHSPGARTQTAEFVAADVALASLQARSTGLITTLARLRQLAHTIEIITDNMGNAVPTESTTDGPFALDQALAKSLHTQVLDDIAFLDIARERAERVSALTSTAVRRGLDAYQQRLFLLQTSVVGAIVMTLAALQALGTTLPLPDPLQIPVISMLGTFTLALPIAIRRWSRGAPPDVPLNLLDYAAVALFGASLGWLVTELVAYHAIARLARPPWPALIAGGSALLVAGLAVRRTLRLRRTD
jgi:hypothetical protein